MLEYSDMIFEDLDAGMTDDFKSDGVKFNIQNNLVPSENKSLKIRNGVSVFDYVGNATDGVVLVDTIDNRPVQIVCTPVNIETPKSFVKIMDSDTRKYKPLVEIKGYPSLKDHIVSSDEWRSALFFNATNGNTTEHIGRIVLTNTGIVAEKATLPLPTVVPSNTSTGRLWAVVTERTYVDANGFTYREYSPDRFGTFSSTNGTYTFTTTVNTGSTKLDDIYQSTIRAVLFISQVNGTVLYRVATQAFGVPSGNGSAGNPYVSSATLSTTTSATTDSNIVSNEIGQFFSEEAKIPLPKADHIKIVNNTLWLLGTTDTDGVRRPYRLYQSVSGMPTSVIANAFYDFQSSGTGLANLNGKLIVGTDGFVYRVDGSIGIDGSGNIQAEAIIGSDQGCIAGRSMVAVGNNLFYCGNDGIYSTDGFTATNISGRQLYNTYRGLIGNSENWNSIVAVHDSFDDLVYWVMPNNKLLMLSLRSGGFSTGSTQDMDILSAKACNLPIQSLVGTLVTSPENGKATVSNQYNFTQGAVYTVTKEDLSTVNLEAYSIDGNTIEFRAEKSIAVAYKFAVNTPIYEYGEANSDGEFGKVYRQHVLMSSKKGYTVAFRDDYISDVELDQTVTDVSNLSRATRPFELLTAGIAYNNVNNHKWVKDLTITLRSNGVISAVPYTIIDNRSLPQYMGEIVSNNIMVPFDKFNIYNRNSMEFDAKGIQTFRRHIPSGACKCRFNQIGIKSADTNLYSSLEYSVLTAEVNQLDPNKINLTMENRFSVAPEDSIKFPRNVVGMSISIALANRVICEELLSAPTINQDGTVDITWKARNVYKAIEGDVFDGTDISGGRYYSGTVISANVDGTVVIRFKTVQAVDPIVLHPFSPSAETAANSVYFTPKKKQSTVWSSKVQILSVDSSEEQIVAYMPAGIGDITNQFYEFVIYGTPIDQDIEIASIGLTFADLSNSSAGKKANSNLSGGFNGR